MHTRTKLYYIVLGFTVGIIFGSLAGLSIPKVYAQDPIQCKAETAVEQVDREKANRAAKQTAKIVADAALDSSFRQVVVGIKRWILSWTYAPPSVILDSNILKKYEDQAIDEVLQIYVQNHPEVNIATIKRQLYEQAPEVVTALAQKYLDSLHLKQLTPFQVAELPNDVVMAISGQELFGISESGVRAQYTASSRALSLVGSLQNEKKDAAYRAIGYIDAKGLYAANIVTGISAGHSAFGDFVLHAIGKAFFQLFSYPEYQLVRVKGDKYLVVTTTDTTYDTFITMYAKEISKTSMVYRVDGRVQKRPVEVNFEPVPDGYILPAYVQTDTRSIVGRHPLLDKYVTAIQSASFDSNVVSFLRSLLQTLYVDDVLEARAAQLEKQYSTREKPVDITVFADWNDAIQSAQERISQDHLSVLRFDVIALLKWVNDTYGDTYGDAYIQKQFDVLVSYLVESLHMQHAVLYRRANEFYVLFDNTSENKPDAASLFDHINRTFSSYAVKDTVYQVMPIVVDVPFTTGDETLTRLGEKASVATRDFIRSYFFDKQGDPQKEISIAHWGWLHKYFYPDVLVEKRGAMRMQSLFGATAQEVAAVPIIPSSFGLFAEISPAWMQAMRQIITKVPLEPEEVVNADALEVADSTTLPSTSAPQIYDLWKMLFSFFQAKWGRLYTVRFDEDYIVHVKRGTHNDMVVQREENVQIFVQRRDVKERVIVSDTVFNLNHGDVIFFGRDVMQGWLVGIGTGNQWYFVETDANGVMLREPTVKSTNVFETTTQNVEILKINDAQSKKEAPVPLPTDVNRQTPVSVDTKKLDALRKQMIEWIITKPTIFGGWVHIETTQKELFKSYMPLVDFFLTRFGDDAALLSRMQIADSDVGPLQGVVETARSLNAISLPQRMWNSTLLPVLYASGNFVISTFEMSTLLQPGDPNNPELDRQLKRAAIAKLAELIETYPGLEGYTLVRLSDTQFAVVLNDKQKATYGSFKQFASQLESIVSGQYVVVYDSQTKRYIQTGIHIQHIEKDVVLIEQAVNLLKYENFIHDGIPSALREMKKDGVTPPPDDVMALFAVARGGALYSDVQIQQFREQNYEFRRLYDLLQNKFFAASPALQKYLIQMIITLELDDTLSSVVYKLNQEFSRGDDQVTKLRVFLNARSAILEASNRYSDPKRNNEFKVLEISLSRDGQNSEEAIRTAFENLGPYLVTHKGLNLEEAIVYHDKQTDRYFVFVNADYPVDIDKMSQGLPNATITETAIAVGKEETPDEMLAKFHAAQDTLARYQEAKKSGSTDAAIRAEIKLAESTNWSLWHQLRSELSDTVHVIWAGVTGGLDWLFVKLPYHPYTHPDGTPLGAFEQFMTILSMRDPNTRVVPKDIPYQVKAGVSFKETLAPKMMAAHLLFALTSDKANYFPGQPLLFDYRTNTSAIRQQLVYPVSIALYDAKTKWWQTLTFTKTELDAFENQSVTEVEKAIRGKIDREKYSGSSKKPEHLVLALVEHGGQMQELPQEFRDAGAPVVISFDSNRTLSVLVDHIVGEGNLVRELTNAVRHALFDDLGERVVYPQILENKTNQRLTVRITDMPDNTSFDDALYPFAYAMKRLGYRAVKTMVSEGNLRDRATVGLLEIFTIPTKERITRMLEQTHAGKGVFNRLVYVYYARVWRYVEPVLTFIFEWIRGLNEFPRALKGPLISFIKGDFEGDPGLLTTILSDYDKNTPTLVILQDKKTGKTRFILQGVKDVWVREQMIRDMEAYFNVRVHGDAPLEWQELTSEQKKASRAKTEIYQPTFANKIIPAQQISQGIRPTSMPTNAQRIGLRENGYFWIGSDATSVVGVREAGGVDMYIERRNAPKGTRERVDQFFTVTHGDAIYFGNDMTGWRIARGGADQLVIIPLDKKGTEMYEEERDGKTYPLYLEFKNIVVPPEGVRQSVPAKVEEQVPLATPMPEQTKQRVKIDQTQTGDGGVVPTNSQTEVIISKSTLDVLAAKVRQQPNAEFLVYIVRKGSDEQIVNVTLGVSGDGKHIISQDNYIVEQLRPYIAEGYEIVADYHNHPTSNISKYKLVKMPLEYAMSPSFGDTELARPKYVQNALQQAPHPRIIAIYDKGTDTVLTSAFMMNRIAKLDELKEIEFETPIFIIPESKQTKVALTIEPGSFGNAAVMIAKGIITPLDIKVKTRNLVTIVQHSLFTPNSQVLALTAQRELLQKQITLTTSQSERTVQDERIARISGYIDVVRMKIDETQSNEMVRFEQTVPGPGELVVNEARKNWWDKVVRTVWGFIAPRLFLTIPYHSQVVPGQIPSIDYVLGDGGLGVQIHETSPAVTIPVEDHGADFSPMRIVGWAGSIQDAFSRTLSPFFDRGWFKHTQGTLHTWSLPSMGRAYGVTLEESVVSADGTLFPVALAKGIGAARERIKEWFDVVGTPKDLSEERYPVVGLAGKKSMIEDGERARVWHKAGMRTRLLYSVSQIKNMMRSFGEEQMDDADAIGVFVVRNPYTFEDVWRVLVPEWYKTTLLPVFVRLSTFRARLFELVYNQAAFLQYEIDPEGKALVTTLVKGDGVGINAWIHWLAKMYGTQSMRKALRGLIGGEDHRQNHGLGVEYRDLSDVAGLPTGHEQEYFDIKDPFDARMRAVQAREVMHTLLPILDLHIAANIARSRMWNDGLDDVIGQFIDGLRRENPEYAEQYISEMRVYFTLMSGLGEGLYDMKFTPMILERKNRRIWLGLSSSFLPSSSSVVHDAIMQSLANYQDHIVVPKMSLAESAAQQIIFEYRNKGMTRSSIVRMVREGAVTPQLLAQQVLHFYQPQIRDVLGETEIQYFVRMLEQFFELSDVFQTISEIRIDNTSFANTVGYASYPDQIPATFVIDVRRDNNSFIERSYIQDDQLTRNDIQRLIEQVYALPLVGTGYQGTYEIRWIDANGDNQRFVGSYSMIPNQGMWRPYYQLRANTMRLREEAWNRVQIRSFFGSIMRAVVGDPVPLNEIETQKKAEKEALKEECVGGVSLLTRPFVITEDEQRQQKDNDHEKAISDRGTGKELVSSNHDDLVFSVNQNDKNKLTIPNGRLLSKSLPYSEFEREKSPGLINNTPNHPEERLIKNAANTSANVFFEMGNINFYSTIRKELSSNDWSGLLVKPAYAADQNAPNTPLNCRVFGVFNIKDFNLNRYPGALLWMQKTQRIGQQFQNLFSFLFPKSLNVVPASQSANVFSFARISNPTTKDVSNFAGIMGSMDFDVLPNKLQNELLRIVGTWLGRTVSRDQWQLAVDELQNNIEDVQLVPRVKLEPPLLFPLEVVYESADAIEKIPFAKKLFSTTPTLESLSGWFDGRTDLHDDRVIVPIYKATFADGSVERILPVATTRSIGVIQQDLARVAALFPPIRVAELSSGHVLVFMRWVYGTKPSTQEVLSFVSSHEDLFLSVSNKYIVRNFDFHELNFVIPTKKAAESMYYVDEDLVLSVIQHGLDEDVTSDKRARYDSANILPLKNELFIEARKQIISQLSSVLPDMIALSREAALQQNPQLTGEALVTAIIPLIEKMSAYQALTQHVPDGMTQVEFLSLLRPTLKDQIEKVISIKQENDSFLKRLVVKLPIIGKILVTPVVLLLTAISGLLLGWKGSTYFENIGIEGFGAIFRLFPNVIREFMEAIYWPIIMWRLADFGAAIMAMASITAVTELIQRVLSGGMRGISNRIVIINSLLASIIYQLYDLERVAPFFTGKQDYSGYVNYLFHPLIFINDAIQNIIQDPGDTVAMMIGIGLIPIVFYGGLGLAKSVVVAVWKKILSWRRGGVVLLLAGVLAVGLLNGTQVQKVVAPIAEVVAAAQDSGCFSYNPFVERVYAADGQGTTCPWYVRSPRETTIESVDKLFERDDRRGMWLRFFVNFGVMFDLVYRATMYLLPAAEPYMVHLPPYRELLPPVNPQYCSNGPCSGESESGFYCDEKTQCYEQKKDYSDTRCSTNGNAEIHRKLKVDGGFFEPNGENDGVRGCDARGCVGGKCIGYASSSDYPNAVLCDTLPSAEAYIQISFEDSAYLPATACRNAQGALEWRLGMKPDEYKQYSCNSEGTALIKTSTQETVLQCEGSSRCDVIADASDCIPTRLLFNVVYSDVGCSPYQTRNDGLICTTSGLQCTPGSRLPKTSAYSCDRTCTDGNPDTADTAFPLNCAPVISNYTDYTCKTDSNERVVQYKTNSVSGEQSIEGVCPTNECSGICVVKQSDACTSDNVRYALTDNNQCLLECVNGKYRKTSMCDKGIEVLTDTKYQRIEIMKALAKLPPSVLENAYVKVLRQVWLPGVNSWDEVVSGTAGDYIDLMNFQENVDSSLMEDLIIHEYMHDWARGVVRSVPVSLPFADFINNGIWDAQQYVLNPLFGGNNAGHARVPESYLNTVNCNLANGRYQYGANTQPVTSYRNRTSDKIPCGEDFADSAAWYVTRSCDLLAGGAPEDQIKNPEAGKIRYEYLKKNVFEGKEYLPEGGCGN